MITTMLEMNFANTEGGLEVSLDEIPKKTLLRYCSAKTRVS